VSPGKRLRAMVMAQGGEDAQDVSVAAPTTKRGCRLGRRLIEAEAEIGTAVAADATAVS
jgi:hypothetical protein